MHPILLQLGPLRLYSYGLLIAIGFLVASALAAKRAGELGLDAAKVQNAALAALLAGLAGGRVFYVVLRWDLFRDNLWEILRLDHGGLVFFGGFAGGLIGCLWAVRRAGLPLARTLDLLIPPAVIGHAFGRVGCFFNGCCFGEFTTLPWGVRFPSELLKRHPTQLYEAAALVGIFFLLKRLERLNPRPGSVLLWYGVLYGTWRFLVEFLRADNPPFALNLTIFQWIGFAMALLCALVLAARRPSTRRSS